MNYDTDPQQRPQQRTADELALECHSLIEVLRRRRLSVKLLQMAVDGLRTISAYKPPNDPNRRKPVRRGEPPPIVVGDLLKQ